MKTCLDFSISCIIIISEPPEQRNLQTEDQNHITSIFVSFDKFFLILKAEGCLSSLPSKHSKT